MNKFNQLLALSGASMAAAIGTLSIGELQDHSYRQDRQECFQNSAYPSEQKTCLSDYDPAAQKSTQENYGLVVLGLGAVSLFMGKKAYDEQQTQSHVNTKD